MTDDDLNELEFLQKQGKFSNRSEVVRHALQLLMSEHVTVESAQGQVTAIVTAVYYKKGQGHNISAVQHEYKKFLSATIHANTSEGFCTEIMILTADATEVRGFLKKLRAQKKVMRVDIALVGGGK